MEKQIKIGPVLLTGNVLGNVEYALRAQEDEIYRRMMRFKTSKERHAYRRRKSSLVDPEGHK